MVNAIKSRPPNAPLNRTDVNSCEKSTLWLVLSRLCPCLGLKLQARYSEGSTCDAAGLAQADQSLTRDSQSNPNFANAPADVAKFSLLLKELDLRPVLDPPDLVTGHLTYQRTLEVLTERLEEKHGSKVAFALRTGLLEKAFQKAIPVYGKIDSVRETANKINKSLTAARLDACQNQGLDLRFFEDLLDELELAKPAKDRCQRALLWSTNTRTNQATDLLEYFRTEMSDKYEEDVLIILDQNNFFTRLKESLRGPKDVRKQAQKVREAIAMIRERNVRAFYSSFIPWVITELKGNPKKDGQSVWNAICQLFEQVRTATKAQNFLFSVPEDHCGAMRSRYRQMLKDSGSPAHEVGRADVAKVLELIGELHLEPVESKNQYRTVDEMVRKVVIAGVRKKDSNAADELEKFWSSVPKKESVKSIAKVISENIKLAQRKGAARPLSLKLFNDVLGRLGLQPHIQNSDLKPGEPVKILRTTLQNTYKKDIADIVDRAVF